jgi:hypothetical protein
LIKDLKIFLLRRNAPHPPWLDKKSIDNILGGYAAEPHNAAQ